LFAWLVAQPCRLALGELVRLVPIVQNAYLAEGGAP
jgi:hypothetical protein